MSEVVPALPDVGSAVRCPKVLPVFRRVTAKIAALAV